MASPSRPVWRSLVLMTALLLGACGSSTPDSIAFVESEEGQSIDTEASPVSTAALFDDGELDLVAFHARWVCELQRRTFPELSGVDEALNETLIGAGLDRETYDGFLIDLSESQDLRDAVLERYTDSCLG